MRERHEGQREGIKETQGGFERSERRSEGCRRQLQDVGFQGLHSHAHLLLVQLQKDKQPLPLSSPSPRPFSPSSLSPYLYP